jgi:hypothetical protein
MVGAEPRAGSAPLPIERARCQRWRGIEAVGCDKLSARVQSQNPGSFAAGSGSLVDSAASFVGFSGSVAGVCNEK